MFNQSEIGSKYFRVIALAISLAFFSIGVSHTAPARSSQQVAVVGKLYQAYAWELFANSDSPFGKSLVDEGHATLRRYFDPVLASLIVRDRRCAERSGELCNLDFDPIFASQDPGAMDMSIRPATDSIVTVEFTYPGNGERIRLDYHFVRSNGVWRIGDIQYFGSMRTSLRQILSHQIAAS